MKVNKLLIGLMACSMSLTACTATTDNTTTQPTDNPAVFSTCLLYTSDAADEL